MQSKDYNVYLEAIKHAHSIEDSVKRKKALLDLKQDYSQIMA